MATHRFHIPDLDRSEVELDAGQAAHARRVLRLERGAEVHLFDGAGTTARGRIRSARPPLRVEVVQRHRPSRPGPWIDLAVAIPKGSRADALVEKASELGADRLIPLKAARAVVQPRDGKLERFRRLAVASASQCGRPWLMELGEPLPFRRLLEQADHDLRLLADVPDRAEDDATGPATAERVLVVIGPEGGWTDRERALARSAGLRPWRLGPYVLRIETAAAAALAILRRST